VSADIFGDRSPHPGPPAGGTRESSLPPPAQPIEPWPVADKPVRDEPVVIPEPEPEPQGHMLRFLAIALFVIAVLAYLVPAFSMAGRILPGTMVLGVDIGGQSETAAAATLRERLYAQTRAPIVVRQGMRRLTVNPQDAGLSLDVGRTVRRALTGFPNPAQVWTALTGTHDVSPVVSVDRAKLDAAVARDVARPLEEPGHEGGVTFRGVTPVAVFPKVGRRVDRQAVANEIQNAYLGPDDTVVVPTLVDQPQVSRAEVRRTVEWAAQAVATPITLVNGTVPVELPSATIARNLTFVREGKTLRPRFDAATAVVGIEPRLIGSEQVARDAGFTVAHGKPALVHARPGKRIDTDRLAADVIQALGGGSRTVAVSVVSGQPRFSDADALRMGVKEEIGRFTTRFDCCVPRAGNIKAAARIVDDHLVRPGETFSFNAVLGRRDAAAGFEGLTATLIHGRTGSDVPGMSQVATTLLNAAMHAGLEIVDYTPPDVHAPQLPAGTEAVVSYPEPDVVWKNDAPYGVLIQASTTGTSLTVKLWSTKRFDVDMQAPVKGAVTALAPIRRSGDGCVPAPGQSGFTAEVTRLLRQDGTVVDRKKFRSVYRPQAQIICSRSTR
jgi:vancomycin resistance protein YoaR